MIEKPYSDILTKVSQPKSATEEGIHGQFEFITYEMELHIPHRIYTQIQTKGHVWRNTNGWSVIKFLFQKFSFSVTIALQIEFLNILMV